MNRQTENIIEIRNMCFRRGSRMLFNDISLDVPRGKVTAIMGPSGIGKTTLLRLIGGQLRPTAARSGLTATISWHFPAADSISRAAK